MKFSSEHLGKAVAVNKETEKVEYIADSLSKLISQLKRVEPQWEKRFMVTYIPKDFVA